MAKRKSFKTITGYLRNIEDKLFAAEIKPNSDDERAHERKIINHLLPQIGVTETILDSETPRDGVDRLLQSAQGERQVKALKDCRKWLGRAKLIGVSVVPQVKTAQGLVTYLVHGFKRDDHNQRISVLVDVPEYSGEQIELAQKIAGPDYCLHASENCLVLIPDSAKNKLFLSNDELYGMVPELNPHRHQRMAR